jgi:NitT/TauT family transport system substrate-binding protein
MLKRFLNLLVYCLIIVMFSSYPAVSVAKESVKQSMTTLKAVIAPYLSNSPFYIAQDEGFFAEQNLQMEFVKLRLTESIVALAQGNVDVAAGFLKINILSAMAQGAKIRAVADKGYIPSKGCPDTAFLARPDVITSGKLKSPLQLQGLRVAMDPVTIEGYYIEKLLATVGLNLGDIEIISMPNPMAEFDAMDRGAVDMLSTAEPWTTRIVQAGHGVIWRPAGDIIPDFQKGFILYGPSILEKNIDAGKRFMVAYLKAVQQYNQGKTDRNLDILSKHTRLKRDLLKKVCWPAMRDNGQINIESLFAFQAWAIGKGYLDTPANGEQIWDSRFVDHANLVLKKGSIR